MNSTITQFKREPTVMPNLKGRRPFQGRCCTCTPNSRVCIADHFPYEFWNATGWFNFHDMLCARYSFLCFCRMSFIRNLWKMQVYIIFSTSRPNQKRKIGSLEHITWPALWYRESVVIPIQTSPCLYLRLPGTIYLINTRIPALRANRFYWL